MAAITEAADAFIQGDSAASLAVVEQSAVELGPDLLRRANRWFSLLDPADGLPHLLLGHLLAFGLQDGDHERIYVALDAHALARDPAGAVLVRGEVESAGDVIDRTRAQRVLVFWLLGQPLSAGLAAEVEVLAELDHPDAGVEAARFRLAVAFRRGDFDAVPRLLHEVDGLMTARYPTSRPWYGDLARGALHHHRPTRYLVGNSGPSSRFLPSPLDQSVASLSRVWHDLAEGRLTAATPGAVKQLAAQLSVTASTAVEIHHLLALGRPHDAEERLRPYRGRLASLPRDPAGHLLPATAGRVAIAIGDDHLAAEVVAALSPWSGEYLGVWTCDLLIGPVDGLLSSLS